MSYYEQMEVVFQQSSCTGSFSGLHFHWFLELYFMLDNLIKLMMMMMSAPLCYLVLLPQRQLRLLLLKFLRTVHHKIDNVDAAGKRQQH